ncbi:MAG: InlB B-repeat-containing protein [Dehalococcoidales bacterium]|nr:InlB B-repeat-containing protein [Dehalococcoidales bacterium]
MNVKAIPIDADAVPVPGAQSPSESDNRTLFQDAVSGDITAFARLCCRHLDRVYTYIFYQVKDRPTAERLVIEIFVEAYKKIQTYKPDREFSLWLYRIAHDYLENDPRFFSNIPFAEKEIVLLKFVQGLDNQAIEWITRQKLTAVRRLQASALLHLLQHKSKVDYKLSENFCKTLDACFLRIASGESMERCLYQNPRLRDQLESLLSLGLYILGTKKVEPGEVFKKKLFDQLKARIQQLPRQILDSMPGKTQDGYIEKAKKPGSDLLTLIVDKIRPAFSQTEAVGAESGVEDSQTAPGNAGILQRIVFSLRTSRIMMISLVLIIVAVIAVAFLLTGVASKLASLGGTAAGCTLNIGSGSVSVLMPGETEWQEISEGIILKESARLKTGAASRASIGFNDGSLVNLEKDTEMEIITAGSAKDGLSVTVLKQYSGRSSSQVTGLTGPDSKFVIETNAAVISVKGTEFITAIKPDGATNVSVIDGVVTVSAQGRNVDIKAGYQLTVAPGEAPGKPSTVSDPETATPTPAQIKEYNLRLKSAGGGKIVSPENLTSTHQLDTQVVVEAVPDAGYAFTGWTGDIAGLVDAASPSISLTIKGDTALTANFARVYTLTIRTFGGAIKSPGESSHSYPAGTVVDLQVTPDKGYEFVNWTGDTTGIEDTKSAQTTITIKKDCSITANFARIYKLTVNKASGGWIAKPGEGSFTFREGTAIDVQAIPDTGYVFAGWTCAGNDVLDPADSRTKVTINKDSTLTARFILPVTLSTLTVKSGSGGKVSQPGASTFTCQKGSVIDLRAVPDAGYGFSEWTGDVAAVDNISSPDTFIKMNGNYTITANFVKAYDLTVNTSAGGTILQPGGITYTCNTGTIVPLKAVPIEGYRFDRWTGDIEEVANPTSAVTTITITRDTAITANFVQDFTVTVSATSGGTVVQPGCGEFVFTGGSVVELVAVADSGYTFVSWSVDGGAVIDPGSPATAITVTGNCRVTASFAQIDMG